MQERVKEFNEFFSETYSIFRKINTYNVLLEKIDANQVDLGAINELRGVLYHLYGYLDEKQSGADFVAANYIEAKEHLKRAYFDLFSGICTDLIEKIYNFSTTYTNEVLGAIYPPYFTDIIPGIYNLFEEISHVRTTRKVEDASIKYLDENDAIVMKLLGWQRSLVM